MVKPRGPHDPDSHRTTRVDDLPLFARARRSDPETSKEAARAVTRSGVAAAQQQAVYEITVKFPSRTSAEIGALMGEDMRNRYVAARRLPELRDAGRVFNDTSRKCTQTGRKAMTWSAT